MTATLAIGHPTCLTSQGKSRSELKHQSNFVLALKHFELGEEQLWAGLYYPSSVANIALKKRLGLK